MGVLSALEMACWDIVGKEAGQPVYNLLGGRVHERLRTYTYIYARPGDATDVYQDPDLAAARAHEYLRQGFTALKFDPVGPYSAFDGRQLSLGALELSERFARQLREAVGNKADLLFGTHGQMTAAGAIRLAHRLEPYDPLWFEEPVPPDAPEEMAKVARATRIPIAAGERLATKYDFARLLQAGAAAILQMNLGRVGGLLEAKKIAGHGRGPSRAAGTPSVLRPGGRRGQHPAGHLQSEFPDSRGHRAMGRLSRRAPAQAHSLERRICHPAHRAGTRRRTERSGGATPPVRGF